MTIGSNFGSASDVWTRLKASADPTGISEANNAASDLKSAWDAFSGQNSFRAPDSVFDPLSSYQPGQSLQDRGAQQNLVDSMGRPNSYYQGLMEGTQPSLAELQMRQGIAQAQKTGMQSAASARGIDRAAAFRNAQNQSANMGAQGAIAGGQQRLQEQQLGAQGLSQGIQAQSNMVNTTRQQDVGEQQGLFGLQNQSQQNLNQQYGINAGITNANAANEQKATGGLVQTVGGLLSSDVRNKEDIRTPGIVAKDPTAGGSLAQALASYGGAQSPAVSGGGQMFNSQDSANFSQIGQGSSDSAPAGGGMLKCGILSDENSKESLQGIHPYEFKYKDAFAQHMATQAANDAYVRTLADAKTPRMGVMAQDLAKNPEAKDTVVNTPEGLAIEGKRAMSLMLANQADFNDRLRKVETGRAA